MKVHPGDCNEVLLKLLPAVRWEDRRRALCLLDPYGIDLAWTVVKAVGATRTVEFFLNFMVMDMNMNVLLIHPERALPGQIDRMNRFWGDESWRQVVYAKQTTLFEGDEEVKVSDANSKIAEAYAIRLNNLAGFQFVAPPLPFLNEQGATIYYLFFASPNKTGHDIVVDIFDKYRRLQRL